MSWSQLMPQYERSVAREIHYGEQSCYPHPDYKKKENEMWPRSSLSWWPCCDRRSSVNLNHQVVKNEIMNYCAQELLVVTQDHLNHGHQVVKIFLCSGASGLFHSKQHHWWGVQRSWPLSMGLLWPRNPIPGAWPIVGIRVWPFLRLGVGGQIQKIWNIEKWINIKKQVLAGPAFILVFIFSAVLLAVLSDWLAARLSRSFHLTR